MNKLVVFFFLSALSFSLQAGQSDDAAKIKQAVLNYIESQHVPSSERMDRALDSKLVKRTYWKDAESHEFILETTRETMLRVAETYNIKGDRFPKKPTKKIKIFDIDGRVATVKLTADDWIDYMHLYKNDNDEWKIINVLWQYHDQSKQQSKK